MLKDTFQELLNQIPGLNTPPPAGSSGSSGSTSETSAGSTDTPPAGGEFICKIKLSAVLGEPLQRDLVPEDDLGYPCGVHL